MNSVRQRHSRTATDRINLPSLRSTASQGVGHPSTGQPPVREALASIRRQIGNDQPQILGRKYASTTSP